MDLPFEILVIINVGCNAIMESFSFGKYKRVHVPSTSHLWCLNSQNLYISFFQICVIMLIYGNTMMFVTSKTSSAGERTKILPACPGKYLVGPAGYI